MKHFERSNGLDTALYKNYLFFTVECADFKVGVMSLATLLQIPTHPDHKQLLKVHWHTLYIAERFMFLTIQMDFCFKSIHACPLTTTHSNSQLV